MTCDATTRLLYGPYRVPRFRRGQVVWCEFRGEVVICGMTDGRIPWPVGKRGRAKSFLICGGLARAIRRESNAAVCYWWGITPQTVTKWRKALGVGPLTDGTHRLKQANYRRIFTPELRARTIAAMNTPEANQKKAKAWLGKPRPPHVKLLLDRTGTKHSPETRAKLRAIHQERRNARLAQERGDKMPS